jgi:carboxyl-terminal processing protease
MNDSGNDKRKIALPLVLALGIAAGMLIGVNLKSSGTWSGGNATQKLREVIGLIERNYVDETVPDDLVDDAIEHLLGKLDPHSVYIPASDREAANEDLRGNYEGIGIEFNIFRDTLTVVTPLSGGPSENAGLLSGDKIIQVDDKNIAGIGLTNAEVYKLLKGPSGTEVNLKVLRRKEEISYSIQRAKIPQFSVDASYMIDKETGYIKINRFASTTYQEFYDALYELKSKGMKKLILDLQGNPGGYMDEATELADEFLSEGKKIVYTKGQNGHYAQNVDATASGFFEKGELIVLINEGSASASEILAGALQDNDRALLVGRRTFGKGLVQNPFNLKDGSELRLTISRYYTPSGRSIQKPYGEDFAYAEDLDNRFKRGEFFHADSIKFNDSLRYKTVGGRSVYGGGGIMPDYFVPLDTTQNLSLLNELYASTTIQEYSLQYAEQNRKRLEDIGLEQYLSGFQVNDEMLSDLMKMAVRNGVTFKKEEYSAGKEVIRIHTKAQIARKIWSNDGFYPVINKLNESLQQAIKIFETGTQEILTIKR